MASRAWNDKRSPFLRLPGEIRNEIYRYVIGGHEALPFWVNSDCTEVELRASLYNESGETGQGWTELFNLSYVCKRLNTETRTLPYKLTVFQVDLGAVFETFLNKLKEKKKQLITTISFGSKHYKGFVYEPFTIPVELYGCSGLKTVISRVTLTAVQGQMVDQYAKDMGWMLFPRTTILDTSTTSTTTTMTTMTTMTTRVPCTRSEKPWNLFGMPCWKINEDEE
jgi:hypothetical protein